jgi:hypothetical protein
MALCVVAVTPAVDFSLQLLRRLAPSLPWVGCRRAGGNGTGIGIGNTAEHTTTTEEMVTAKHLAAFLRTFRYQSQRFTTAVPRLLRLPQRFLSSSSQYHRGDERQQQHQHQNQYQHQHEHHQPHRYTTPPVHLLPALGVSVAAAFAGIDPEHLATLYSALMHQASVVVVGSDTARVRTAWGWVGLGCVAGREGTPPRSTSVWFCPRSCNSSCDIVAAAACCLACQYSTSLSPRLIAIA